MREHSRVELGSLTGFRRATEVTLGIILRVQVKSLHKTTRPTTIMSDVPLAALVVIPKTTTRHNPAPTNTTGAGEFGSRTALRVVKNPAVRSIALPPDSLMRWYSSRFVSEIGVELFHVANGLPGGRLSQGMLVESITLDIEALLHLSSSSSRPPSARSFNAALPGACSTTF
jgi:hypothetical protein